MSTFKSAGCFLNQAAHAIARVPDRDVHVKLVVTYLNDARVVVMKTLCHVADECLTWDAAVLGVDKLGK